MKKKIVRCPLCRMELKKAHGKKVCTVCGVEVVGDTLRHLPPAPFFWQQVPE